jgi:hypothetical protein
MQPRKTREAFFDDPVDTRAGKRRGDIARNRKVVHDVAE